MSSDQTFSKYIVPAGPIDQEASDVHGLYIQKDKLGQLLITLKQDFFNRLLVGNIALQAFLFINTEQTHFVVYIN